MRTDTLKLTPTNRLARALLSEFAVERQKNSQTCWIAPQIQSFGSWIAALQQDWLLHGSSPQVPIDRAQAAFLWQSVVADDVFIGSPRVADLAMAAWQRLHDYALLAPEQWNRLPLSQDNRYFRRWVAAYQRRCEALNVIDEYALAAALPTALSTGQLTPPGRIHLQGFVLPLTPLQQRILDACEEAGTVVVQEAPAVRSRELPKLRAFQTDTEEFRAAARWARSRLDHESRASIGVVVPTLAGRVNEIERILREEFDAPSALLASDREPTWHVSLGQRLSDWPLVADALHALSLTPDRLTQPELLALINAPHFVFASEAAVHWATIAELRLTAPFELTLFEWRRILSPEAVPLSQVAIDRWAELRSAEAGWAVPSSWATRFQQELSALDFASTGTLNSRSYQCLQRWHQCLDQLSRLDGIVDGSIDRASALNELRIIADSTVFRERNAGAQLEVLGIEEALGGRFDALWITGLDNSTWPGPSRRDPLLPAVLQHEIPGATSESALATARATLNSLYNCATTVQHSYARGADDERSATALVPNASGEALGQALPSLGSAPNALCESLPSDAPPPVTATTAVTPGGTGVLRSQAACPFQAFGRYRLAARDLVQPRPGLNPAERGKLAHSALEAFFREHPDQQQLKLLDEKGRKAAIETAIDSVLRRATRRFRHLLPGGSEARERQRLLTLLTYWIEDIELARPPFRVREREATLTLEFGALHLSGQLDRIDELEDGTELLIDYKSGEYKAKEIDPDGDTRALREPQLPAYALNRPALPRAVAFANLKPGSLGYAGYSEEPTDIQGIRPCGDRYAPANWQALADEWSKSLNSLAGDFLTGDARVAPTDPSVCTHCHLKALCRINDDDRLSDTNKDGETVDE